MTPFMVRRASDAKRLLIHGLRCWREAWRSLEGPELEPRFWHSHFLTAYHSGKALKRLGCDLRGRVIDIGAGSGHGARYLNPALTEYFPTDLPTGRSAEDARISQKAQRPMLYCSVYELPLPSADFDAALMLNVLEHLSSPQKGLSEVFRVLRPGAPLLFCVPFAFPLHGAPGDYRRWTVYGLAEEMVAAGFEVQEIRPCDGTLSSLVLNANLCLRYEIPQLVVLTPFFIVLQGVLNVLALMLEPLLRKAHGMPLVYVGLACKPEALQS